LSGDTGAVSGAQGIQAVVYTSIISSSIIINITVIIIIIIVVVGGCRVGGGQRSAFGGLGKENTKRLLVNTQNTHGRMGTVVKA